MPDFWLTSIKSALRYLRIPYLYRRIVELSRVWWQKHIGSLHDYHRAWKLNRDIAVGRR